MNAVILRLSVVKFLILLTLAGRISEAQTSSTLKSEDTPTSTTIDNPQDLIRAAEAAVTKGRYADAIADYEGYLEKNPDDDDQRIQLARALVAAGSHEKGLQVIEEVLGRQPDSTDALLIRGNIRLWQKDYSSARTDLESVINKAPDYCDAYVSLAKSYLWDGNRDKARDILNSAPEKCRKFEDYKVTLSQLETEPEQPKDPVSVSPSAKSTAAAKTVSAPAEDFDKMILKARELISMDNKPSAEMIVDYILTRNPKYADALLLKGLLALWRQCPAEAEYWFQRTLEVAPSYCEAYYGLSNVQIQYKNYQMARTILMTRPECSCTADGIAQQGRVENADGNYAVAKELFAQAVTMQPDSKDFQEALESVDLYTNTTTVHVERFKQSGTHWSVNNTLTFRPCKEVMWNVVLEHLNRAGESDERAGGGVTWHPNDDTWISANALVARHEDVVPSRYDTDLTYRILDCPGTYLRAGAIYYHTEETSAWSRYLGVRQSLTEFWHLEYRRIWSDTIDPSREHAHADDLNLRYEKEEERIVTIGLTRGREAYSESLPAFDTAAGSYAMESVYASWKEWMHEDWGITASASQSARSNGNDSRALSVGVFFEF